jgi:hypothetical protein
MHLLIIEKRRSDHTPEPIHVGPFNSLAAAHIAAQRLDVERFYIVPLYDYIECAAENVGHTAWNN